METKKEHTTASPSLVFYFLFNVFLLLEKERKKKKKRRRKERNERKEKKDKRKKRKEIKESQRSSPTPLSLYPACACPQISLKIPLKKNECC